MHDLRQQLHALVDQLPDHALDHARSALEYCAAPEKQQMTIEQAKRRAKENAERHLREYANKAGRGFISAVGSGGGATFVDGTHHSSMIAFENGKNATYHLYVYRGHMFEIIETVEISADGKRLIRSERITAADGSEQILTAELFTGTDRPADEETAG